MVRRALTRQTRWYQHHCSTFKIKDFIVQKPFGEILEFWPLVTSSLTWAKKWLKWFRNDFSRAFERRFPFCSTMRRSRDRRGVFKHPPSRWWKIQRLIRARVKWTIPPCSKLFFIPKLYVKRFSMFHWSCYCWSPFSKKKIYIGTYYVIFHKSTLRVLINFGFRYIFGARVIQWFYYSKHLHVNCSSCQWSKWSIATSLSPKRYSANSRFLHNCRIRDQIFFQRRHHGRRIIFKDGMDGILKVYIWSAFGVASNGKSVKCWCGNSEVGVATATPAIQRAPPMEGTAGAGVKNPKFSKTVFRR